ncbi:Dynein heavy chain and region D6 of dynein motor [Carpediemonas membranifera]|uniref:Dynein-1, subspecies f n=1 Tax=Carpediemonas membranifera TaxID=201153 RepID=A0A8J6B7J8_9EUKA|nr:Dynein heavy chain and region D6 of dynein motor [Carpediemonas membranifera]|eukprot:KAG9397278.1 Dynein heavy chain and region D6 of dynein motor [Carpediemonas membranifera]
MLPPLQEFLSLLNTVIVPLLRDGDFIDSVKDFHHQSLERFLAVLTELVHGMNNQTVLYVPEIEPPAATDGDSLTEYRHRCENLVIHWTSQIKKLVNEQDTTSTTDNARVDAVKFDEDGYPVFPALPGPAEEIQFWTSRAKDLSSVANQLTDEEVQRICDSLKKTSSSYLKAFNDLAQTISSRANEAAKNREALQLVDDLTKDLDLATPNQIPDRIPGILKGVASIFKNALYYNQGSCERIAGLFRRFSNQIIMICARNISLSDIFDGDVELAITALRQSIRCGAVWREEFAKVSAELSSEDRFKDSWSISPDSSDATSSSVFAPLDAFVQRCRDLLELCEGCIQFSRADVTARILKARRVRREQGVHFEIEDEASSVEKDRVVRFGGARGSEIRRALSDIERKYIKHLDRIKHLEYHLLDVKRTGWHEDFASFKQDVKDVEVMFQNIIKTAFESATSTRTAVELLDTFSHLARRGGIIRTVEKKVTETFVNFFRGCEDVRTTFENGKRNPPLHLRPSQPQYAGTAAWCRQLTAKLNTDWGYIEKYVPEEDKRSREQADAVETYRQISQTVSEYVKTLYSEWVGSLDGKGWNSLDRHLICTSRTSPGLLEVNFDPNLHRASQEAAYWSRIGFEVPYFLKTIAEQAELNKALRERVVSVVREYNRVVQALAEDEAPLFAEIIADMTRAVREGITELVWSNSEDVPPFVAKATAECKATMARVQSFHEARAKIAQQCAVIADYPLLQIEKKTTYSVEDFLKLQESAVKRATEAIGTAHGAIVDALQQVYPLFRRSGDVQQAWASFVKEVDTKIQDAVVSTTRNAAEELSKAIVGDPADSTEGQEPQVSPLLHISIILGERRDAVRGTTVREVTPVPTLKTVQSTLENISRMVTGVTLALSRLGAALTRKEEEATTRYEEEQKAARAAVLERMARQGVTPSAADQTVEPLSGEVKPDYHIEQTPDYSTVVRNDSHVQNVMQAILAGTQAVEPKLLAHIRHFNARNVHDPESGYSGLWTQPIDKFIERIERQRDSYGLVHFQADINRDRGLEQSINAEDTFADIRFIHVDNGPLKRRMLELAIERQTRLLRYLATIARRELGDVMSHYSNRAKQLSKVPQSIPELSAMLKLVAQVANEDPSVRFGPLQEKYDLLAHYQAAVPTAEVEQLEGLEATHAQYKKLLEDSQEMLRREKASFKEATLSENKALAENVKAFREKLSREGPKDRELNADTALARVATFKAELDSLETKQGDIGKALQVFDVEPPVLRDMASSTKDIELLNNIWAAVSDWRKEWAHFEELPFTQIDPETLDETARLFQKRLFSLKAGKTWPTWIGLKEDLDKFRAVIEPVRCLKNPGLRDRHWQQLSEELGQPVDPADPKLTMGKLLELGVGVHSEAIELLSSSASQELSIEQGLADIRAVWGTLTLEIAPYKTKELFILKGSDDLYQVLEDHMVTLGAMKESRFIAAFETEVDHWESQLSTVAEVVEEVLAVQRAWMYLENIFVGSEDIRRQLPAETQQFDQVNRMWKRTLGAMNKDPRAIPATHADGLLDRLVSMEKDLDSIQKSLDQYLETKRKAFPRFYFLSNDDLLEILGQARNPLAVQAHLRKAFDGIKSLELVQPQTGRQRALEAHGMVSVEGEKVPFISPVICEGAVESWLKNVELAMQATLKKILVQCRAALVPLKRERWVTSWPSQLTLTVGLIHWTTEVHKAFNGDARKGLRSLKKKQLMLLHKLTQVVRGELTPLDRARFTAIITVEVHSRDVIEKLIKKQVSSERSFDWSSQLRFYLDGDKEQCIIQQTNTTQLYAYEFIGASGRLVITPLTDRCYMTLTTAMHLKRGGSPQGPAGTGKTETVKDLAKALAKMCVVFNCSEGLDYKSLGRMFSGLAQTGGWGCFDEFNRIDIEVLSVVAQQILSILNALSENLTRFVFEGQEIPLNSGCGIFITMNPGYAGRTELPDNLKSLFRPVSMMVPDFALIAEIILFSIGFSSAKLLSKKLITLYDLAKLQLSKQCHYDFGLRAIKAVLTSAGHVKRSEPSLSEEQIMLRVLRDSNLPKFVSEDVPLFTALISDLFPSTEAVIVDYGDLEKYTRAVLEEWHLQPTKAILQKVFQLYETKNARHGVMIIGNTGAGKSTVWRTLAEVLTRLKNDGVVGHNFELVHTSVINAKALTQGELFGETNFNTGEWKDGVMSSILRDASADEKPDQKWIVADCPIDTLWIESMNTVLDDSKILTLINGERISFPSQVSFLFEARDLAVASPATVSRCGMIYMDRTDLGYKPVVKSWLDQKTNKEEQAALVRLFDKFLPPVLELVNSECEQIVEVDELSTVKSLMDLYDILGTPENGLDPADADMFGRMVELWFVFSLVWSIGGVLNDSSRRKFDLVVRDLEGQFPAKDTVFEYFVDPRRKVWAPWDDKVPGQWRPPAHIPVHKVIVPTVDTARSQYLLSALVRAQRNVMLAGATGTGKTAFILDGLFPTLPEKMATVFMNFSVQTNSNKTQELIESRLEKKTKGTLGPPGNRRLVAFTDDFNMPKKDEFGSMPPLELLRQLIEYGGWYDRGKQAFTAIRDVQLLAGMAPPGGGRQQISERLMSRFNVLALVFPSESQIKRIFGTLLGHHFADFDEEIRTLTDTLTRATLEIYQTVTIELLPTPIKSHYIFNLRDLAKVFYGMMQINKSSCDSKDVIHRLWTHELYRVFGDRLCTVEDKKWFDELLNSRLGSTFSITLGSISNKGRPPLFTDFMSDDPEERVYEEITDRTKLKAFVEEALDEYNASTRGAQLNLVLFQDALDHICRINRVLQQPQGNVLLIGVGGSGRQSVARVAAHLAGMEVFQIEIKKNYRTTEFHEDLKGLFRSAGIDGKDIAFIMTDAQVVEESFLEDVNNILSCGEVPNLFTNEEVREIRDSLRDEAKKTGVADTDDAVYQYFINRAREHLHVVFCMSPVGEPFRRRLRTFPALVSNVTIDWFSEWPADALLEVGTRFMQDVSLTESVKEAIVKVFVTIQSSVLEISARMMEERRRKNYVTPTNYLELVSGYKEMLDMKRKEIGSQHKKLQGGVHKLVETRETVERMSVELAEKKVLVAKAQKECEELLVVIVQERRVADERNKHVAAESQKLAVEEAELQAVADDAQADLDKAIPALEAAEEALKSLNKKDIAEIKAFARPPPLVEKVLAAVMILRKSEPTWAESKKQISDPNFLSELINYPKDSISDGMIKKLSKYIADKEFQPDVVGKVSFASKSLCQWVLAMQTYARIAKVVAPKKAAVAAASDALDSKKKALKKAQAELEEIQAKLAELKTKYDTSVGEKERLRAENEQLEIKLDRAGKLVEGLAGEKTRWEKSIVKLEEQLVNLPGDCVLATAFLSYCGPFSGEYREDLVKRSWVPEIKRLEIPVSDDFSLVSFLASPSDVRNWQIQGLPSDDFSTENGLLITTGRRWPLMIDPQRQANRFIKNLYRDTNLKVVDLKSETFLRDIVNSVKMGTPTLLQDVGEELDPALDPLLNKNVKKEGGRTIIKIGDEDVDFNPNFKFFITTRIENPAYSPEISTKVTLVNFTIREEGLKNQLLGLVVQKERPDLEEQKNSIVVSMAAMTKRVEELEDVILGLLSSASGSLLDDEQLVNALQSSKATSAEIQEQMLVSEKTEKKIDKARQAYEPAARRAAQLFFVLNDIGQVDTMYQFALDAYIKLYAISLQNSPRADDVEQRIENLNSFHTYATYRFACRGLFERHKLLLAFQMCVKILQGYGKIDQEDYQFFLRGGVVLDKEDQPPNPAPEWLPNSVWDNLTELDKLESFKNILPHVEQHLDQWKKYYTANSPETTPLPGDWDSRSDELKRMVILRCLRPDRVLFAVRSFIVNNLGQQFTEPPPFDLQATYNDSTPTTPLVFILSAGVDPMALLKQFAATRNMTDKLFTVSLGQGQAPIAKRLIEEGARDGNWVLLSNCHLSISWLPALEKIIEDLATKEDLHKGFRLWLSSDPHPKFPIGILQAAVKMTTEAPSGLRANILRLYTNMGTDALDRCKADPSKDAAYRKLLFSLCYFHSLLIERKKFRSLGFAVMYDFNDSDFDICANLLGLYINEYTEIPWSAVKYLTAEANYGGRVTDDWDRKLLNVYMDQLYNDDVIEQQNYRLSSLTTYFVPEPGNLKTYKEYIQTLPSVDHPEAFGQHPNADIASQIEETNMLLSTIVSLQPRLAQKGARSRESIIQSMCVDLLEKIPEDLVVRQQDIDNATELTQPLVTVLRQEVDRYNSLLRVMRVHLKDVQLGLAGLVAMSAELENVATCMFENRVPDPWGSTFNSKLSLAPWVIDLINRVAQLEEWSNNGPPPVTWVGGLTFPTAFFTALLQQASRKLHVGIDTLAWQFTVTKTVEWQREIKRSPDIGEGAYISGLYLEGAAWDIDRGVIRESQPMELTCPLPVVHFRPVEARKKKVESVHETPCYYYPIRTGSRERPSYMLTVDLTTEKPTEHWTKRGVALLMNLG